MTVASDLFLFACGMIVGAGITMLLYGWAHRGNP